jgi:hypothetical protein
LPKNKADNDKLALVLKTRYGELEENKEILKVYKTDCDDEDAKKKRDNIQKKCSYIYVKQIRLMNDL